MTRLRFTLGGLRPGLRIDYVALGVEPEWDYFERTGHCWFALLSALVGGWLAQYFFAAGEFAHDEPERTTDRRRAGSAG